MRDIDKAERVANVWDRAPITGTSMTPRRSVRQLSFDGGVLLLLGLVTAFMLLTTLVLMGRTERFDGEVVRAVHGLLSPTLTRVMGIASVVGGKAIVLLPMLALGLLAQRRPRAALVILGVGAGAVALNTPLKVLIHRSPPGPLPLPPLQWTANPLAIQQYLSNNYSFPSGHVLTVTIVAGLAAYLARNWLPGLASRLVVVGAVVAVGVVGFSRVYLGTYHPPRSPEAVYYPRHFPTDVVGAVLLGGAWLTVAILLLRHLERGRRGQ